MKTYFITGTDTDVGKTKIACDLLRSAQQEGLKTIGFKPVASGCQWNEKNQRLENSDAVQLMAAMTENMPYEIVNPVALLEPMAPHIALQKNNKTLSIDDLLTHYDALMEYEADVCVIEGAGGWRVPLNETDTWTDFVREIECDIVLVVGLRLGCLNHTLLTAEMIERDGFELAGWVANQIDPDMLYVEENIETLKEKIAAPYWGFVPFNL